MCIFLIWRECKFHAEPKIICGSLSADFIGHAFLSLNFITQYCKNNLYTELAGQWKLGCLHFGIGFMCMQHASFKIQDDAEVSEHISWSPWLNSWHWLIDFRSCLATHSPWNMLVIKKEALHQCVGLGGVIVGDSCALPQWEAGEHQEEEAMVAHPHMEGRGARGTCPLHQAEAWGEVHLQGDHRRSAGALPLKESLLMTATGGTAMTHHMVVLLTVQHVMMIAMLTASVNGLHHHTAMVIGTLPQSGGTLVIDTGPLLRGPTAARSGMVTQVTLTEATLLKGTVVLYPCWAETWLRESIFLYSQKQQKVLWHNLCMMLWKWSMLWGWRLWIFTGTVQYSMVFLTNMLVVHLGAMDHTNWKGLWNTHVYWFLEGSPANVASKCGQYMCLVATW